MDLTPESEQSGTAVDAANYDVLHRPPVRIAVAGLGRAALLSHLPALESLNDLFEIVAVCDLRKERRDIVERSHPDVHTYRHMDDMLDDPDIEIVLVSLPTTMHQKTALDVLAHDKWAIVETPLALSHEDALVLRAASIKARGRLIPYTPGIFEPDYRLTLMALGAECLGEVYEVRIRRQDYIRRDDWQTIKRCGGGAMNYAAQDAFMQAAGLLRSPPSQLWSELKRVASLGDAEDFARIVLKTRGGVSADIEINGGAIPPFEPSFTLRGSRGVFTVAAGARSGMFHAIDPKYKFPRRRSSVRIPPLEDLHEDLPICDIPISLPDDCETGCAAFWRAAYGAVRVAAPIPAPIDDVMEVLRYMHLVKISSPFIN